MEQLCASLKQPSPSARSSSPSSGSGAARAGSSASEALLLALRGVSLAGESIGAEDASGFRKVRERVTFPVIEAFRMRVRSLPPRLHHAPGCLGSCSTRGNPRLSGTAVVVMIIKEDGGWNFEPRLQIPILLKRK